MQHTEHYQKHVVTIDAKASVRDVALQLREHGLGALIVMDGERPVGILTDRDLLRCVIATERDVHSTTAADVMSQPLLSVRPDDPLEIPLERMADAGVRRMPVIREDGTLTGILTLDDLFVTLCEELAGIAEGIGTQFRAEQRSARAAQRRRELEARLKDLVDQIERLGGEARDALLRQVDSIRQHLRSGRS